VEESIRMTEDRDKLIQKVRQWCGQPSDRGWRKNTIGKFLIVDYQSDPLFRWLNDVSTATNFGVKMGEIGRIIFIVALAFQNGLEYRRSDLEGKPAMIWLHCVCANLVNVVQ